MSDDTMRITGMASGLGTDSIIAVLIAARSKPIDKLKSKVLDEEVQLTAYTKMQTLASTLQSAAYKLTLSSTWSAKTATSTDTDVLTASATSKASTGTYKIVASSLASAETVRGTKQTDSSATYSGTFQINGVNVDLGSTGVSLSKVASAINTASSSMADGKKVKAYIVNSTLVVENEASGNTSGSDNSAAITFTDSSTGSDGVLKTLGILNSSNAIKDKTDGSDFSGTVNGVAVTSSSNVLSNVVTGLTVSVSNKGESTVTVGNDTAGIEDAVTDFLDAYNALHDYIQKNTKVTTTSAGEAISAGILQGQFYPSSLETKLFKFMSTIVDNKEVDSSVSSLYKLGITRDSDTGDYSITDSKAFSSALTSNFDDVQNLFKGGDANGYYGIAKNMDTFLDDTVLNKLTGSLPSIIDQTNNDMTANNSKIDTLKARLLSYETSLYTHYASMESMVQSWNSQLKYLLSSLGVSS